MREVRVDPTTGRRVLIAPERLRRPGGSPIAGLPDVPAADCPFCPGHEASTASTIASRGEPWVARAFPNRFPALVVEHDPAGAHEVLVESPDHDVQLWQAGPERCAQALGLARDRMRDLSGDGRFAYLAWFRNHGIRAGSSQPHPHAQLVALPYVPTLVDEVVRRVVPDGMDEVVARARQDQRLVFDGDVLALCPWAPRYPFETWLLPAHPMADFRDCDDATIDALATAMHHTLGALHRELAPLAYCATLFTRPLRAHDVPGFRWHIRIQPRPEITSGFEASTGDTINGVPPEVAARLLRGA